MADVDSGGLAPAGIDGQPDASTAYVQVEGLVSSQVRSGPVRSISVRTDTVQSKTWLGGNVRRLL